MRRVRRRLARAAALGIAAASATLTLYASPVSARPVLVGSVPVFTFSASTGAGAVRSPAGCTPARPYRSCQRYSFTGTDQWFIVPGRVTSIRVLEWGAGGGGARAGRPQYPAGAGGFTSGVVAVQPGEEFTVSVGQGGVVAGAGFEQNIYGGGGFGGNGAHPGGTGGGMSALWANGYGITPVLIAGGGGGASPGSQTEGSGGHYPAVIGGGAGGGLGGGSDGTGYSGQGGSQNGGGEPGSPGADCGDSGPGGTAPTPGQQYYGGNGAGSDPAPAGDDVAANGGGGGGGGYYGGGGGRCQVDANGTPGGDGGGGSGYLARAGVSRGYMLRGADGNRARTGHGAPPAAGALDCRFYRPGIGWGGGNTGAANGGNGQVVIEWGYQPRTQRKPHPARHHPPRRHVARRDPAGPREPRVPLAAPPVPAGQALPRSGFPFLSVGVVAVVLIGLGILVMWAGRRRRQS